MDDYFAEVGSGEDQQWNLFRFLLYIDKNDPR